MFARVTTFQVRLDRLEEGAQFIQERIVPNTRQRPGIKNGFWLADRKTGKGMVVTVWEDEAALRATEATAAQLRAEVESEFGTRTLSVESFEVIGHV